MVSVDKEAVLEDGSLVFTHTEQPVFAPPGPLPQYNTPTAEDLLEIVKLRKEDPAKWTVGALAEKFRVSPYLVMRIAPASEDHLKAVEEKRKEAERLISLEKKRKKRTRGLGLAKTQAMNRERYRKMVEAAGGLKQLMKAQNFVFRDKYRGKRKPKPTPPDLRHARVVAGANPDEPLKSQAELESLINWIVPPNNNIRWAYESKLTRSLYYV